jgi:hypothetical protein
MKQAAMTEFASTPASTVAKEEDAPAIAVIGRNGKDTPRGAWFAASDIDAAISGADQMGIHAIRADNPEISQLAHRLPKGRVFDSGKLFTPLIQTSVYEQLLAHLPEHGILSKPKLVISDKAIQDGKGTPETAETDAEGTRPTDWSKIRIGSLVLAEDAPADGWFEAIVLERKQQNIFSLKWRDYPVEPSITRHVSRLALMMQPDAKTSA